MTGSRPGRPKRRGDTAEASTRGNTEANVGSRRKFIQHLRSSPWMIAILAPLLTALLFGFFTLGRAKYHEAANPLVAASAEYDSSRNHTWVMAPQQPIDVSHVPATVKSCDAMRSWLLNSHAPDMTESRVRLHLVGVQSETVTISGVHAEILSRTPANSAAVVTCPTAGNSATPHVALDLRQSAPVAQDIVPSKDLGYVPGTDGAVQLGGHLGGSYFASHVITLANGEPYDLSVTAFVSGTDVVSWRLVVDVERSGKEASVTAHGPMFLTAAPRCQANYGQYLTYHWDSPTPGLKPTSKDSLCQGNQSGY
jgi:hypothetical protein